LSSYNARTLEAKAKAKEWTFEAKVKAKDRTFEAEAKVKASNFCPQGASRPRPGLEDSISDS
jgi:predicted nuclease of restriction endonuclease-like RecB superfamily